MCLYIGAWYGVLAIVSQLAVVTNAILIAITSNFVGFEVYRRGGYQDDYNDTGLVPQENGHDQGLSGYVNWSSTEFLVDDLVDGSAFPVYSAQRLVLVNDDGTDVRKVENGRKVPIDEDDPPLYLPFINFTCIKSDLSNCSDSLESFAVNQLNGERTVDTYTEDNYKSFYMDRECRKLVFNVDDNDSPRNSTLGPCFNSFQTCR